MDLLIHLQDCNDKQCRTLLIINASTTDFNERDCLLVKQATSYKLKYSATFPAPTSVQSTKMRCTYGGHASFYLRYTWLPDAEHNLQHHILHHIHTLSHKVLLALYSLKGTEAPQSHRREETAAPKSDPENITTAARSPPQPRATWAGRRCSSLGWE